MKCSNCGNELKEGAKFCNKCGTSQKAAEPAASAQPPEAAPKPDGAAKAASSQAGAARAQSRAIQHLNPKNKKLVLIAAGVCAVLVLALVCILLFSQNDPAPNSQTPATASGNSGTTSNNSGAAPDKDNAAQPPAADTGAPLNYGQAVEKLRSLLQDVDVKEVEPRKIAVQTAVPDLSNELPELTSDPMRVVSDAAATIIIFSSTEKAEPGNDNWLAVVSENFNKQGFKTSGGADMGVTMYSIASGMAADYIISGKHRPDAFTPSNELWGDMIKSAGVTIELKAKRIAGNTAGILMKKDIYAEFKEKYGEINGRTITEAVQAGGIGIGYTNPLVSSTGLNFLLTALYTYDENNPLSDTAKAGFNTFQANLAAQPYTTLEMRNFAGGLDAMVYEYQQYRNTPELVSGWEFTPIGVRHDSPVYAIGSLSADKAETLDKFIEFCLSDDNQKLAKDKGFNYLDDYEPQLTSIDGSIISQAQKLWKQDKNAGRPVAAVFVADISDNMNGEPLSRLKEALKNAINYIGLDNYVGLISYSDTVNMNLPINKFNYNQQALFLGAADALNTGSGTATFSAVLAALDELAKLKEEDPDIKPMVFLLSADGQNKGHSLDEVSDVVKGMGIPVHTINYNFNLDELKTVSEISGASSVEAKLENITYTLRNLFNMQM